MDSMNDKFTEAEKKLRDTLKTDPPTVQRFHDRVMREVKRECTRFFNVPQKFGLRTAGALLAITAAVLFTPQLFTDPTDTDIHNGHRAGVEKPAPLFDRGTATSDFSLQEDQGDFALPNLKLYGQVPQADRALEWATEHSAISLWLPKHEDLTLQKVEFVQSHTKGDPTQHPSIDTRTQAQLHYRDRSKDQNIYLHQYPMSHLQNDRLQDSQKISINNNTWSHLPPEQSTVPGRQEYVTLMGDTTVSVYFPAEYDRAEDILHSLTCVTCATQEAYSEEAAIASVLAHNPDYPEQAGRNKLIHRYVEEKKYAAHMSTHIKYLGGKTYAVTLKTQWDAFLNNRQLITYNLYKATPTGIELLDQQESDHLLHDIK